MTLTKSHVIFDRAEASGAIKQANHTEDYGPESAIDLGTDKAFYVESSGDHDKNPVALICHVNEPVDEEIHVLEIAFPKGKLRKTKFSVDYVNSEGTKHHIGTYESTGQTTNYEKFFFPEKVKDIQTICLTFKSNDDGSPWFAVKGVRLARFIEKPL
jgi:hypothetical protein